LRQGCNERNPAAMAAGPPAAVPYLLGGQSPGLPDRPATQNQAVSQNTPATPIPSKPEADPPASDAAGPPTQFETIARSCTLQIADAPQHMTGRVTGFLSGEDALAETRVVEAQLGAKISPAYLSLKRARVEAYPRNGNWATMAAIPEHMAVKSGDVVELNSRHRDSSLPCNFVPWTIDRRADHAK
jgi:hypothetical protein